MSEGILTPKQARFVEEYLVDLNGTQAAIRAGYSAATANRIAFALLSKTDIQAGIAVKRASLSEKTGRTVQAVMADIGRVRDDAMKLIEDPETGERSMLSHKDALKALELEGKHVGAFEVDNRQRNPLGNFNPGAFFADLFRKPTL